MSLESNERADRHVELAQSVGTAEIRQIDDETGGKDLGAQLAQELHRPFRRSAGRDQIIDKDDTVPLLYRVLVHFHLVQPVFQRIGDGNAFMRKLALLADRHETSGYLVRDRSAQDEAARLDAGNLVDL